MIQGGTRKKQNGTELLVSIITVVFNGVQSLEETIVSVSEKLTDNVEYIVIDGGSTDGTVELIRKHEKNIDHWISESDSGIYDAINKGIKISKGHFFYVLNVGDKLITLPIAELQEGLKKNADVVMFEVQLSDGRIIKSTIDYRTRFGNTIHHQGAFYRRGLNIEYNLAYKVFADFDMNQKLFLLKKYFMPFNTIVSYHSLDGISNDRKYRREYFSVIRKNFGFFWAFVGFIYLKQGEFRSWIKKMLAPGAGHLPV